jgi:hypothetical protein
MELAVAEHAHRVGPAEPEGLTRTLSALAVHRGDSVFILLQASGLTSAAAILFLARRYREMVCATHAHLTPAAAAPVVSGSRRIREA